MVITGKGSSWAIPGARELPTVAPKAHYPELELGAATTVQQAHLAAARALDVGALPPTAADAEGQPDWRATLGGAVDNLGFRLMRRFFSGAHRKELGGAAGYGELEGGWLARSEAATLPGAEAAARASYFPRPPLLELQRHRVGELPGGAIEDLSFESGGYADRPGARLFARTFPANTTARARLYRHDAPGSPALLWLHGWGMGFPRIEAIVAQARAFYRRGLDVYLITLPYHGARRPPGVHFAGELFPTTHIARSNEAFLQAAWECQALARWHGARGGGPVGAAGLSLGGYVTAMLASVMPELAFAIGVLPVADIPTLMWSNGEGTEERQLAERAGIDFATFCRAMAVHAPLSRSLAIPKERVMLIGGRGDRIVPAAHTRALWRHWNEPALHWMPGSHLLPFGRGAYRVVMERFLEGLGLI